MHKSYLQQSIDQIRYLKANAKNRWLLAGLANAVPSTAIQFEPIANEDCTNKWYKGYKITHKCRNLKFIHVGKCGGTSIMHHFLTSGVDLQEYHLARPQINTTNWYFLWIRNPLNRFVSAFNHSKIILDFDISTCDQENLTLDNCPAPQKIRNRINHGFTFDPLYDHLINSFSSANELAESLSSSNQKQRMMAYNLMTHEREHIFKGLGWYLSNGLFLKKCFRQLVFVGRIENFTRDFQRLCNLVSFPESCQGVPDKKRANHKKLDCYLSDQAIKNLRKFYANSDYKTLATLVKYRLLEQEVLEEYNCYSY